MCLFGSSNPMFPLICRALLVAVGIMYELPLYSRSPGRVCSSEKVSLILTLLLSVAAVEAPVDRLTVEVGEVLVGLFPFILVIFRP